jgi:hypothetical protein
MIFLLFRYGKPWEMMSHGRSALLRFIVNEERADDQTALRMTGNGAPSW